MSRELELSTESNLELKRIASFVGDRRKYNISVLTYSGNEYVAVHKGCFAFMFTNLGDTIATVSGMVIFPSTAPTTSLGDSRTISGHELEVFAGNITLSFRAPLGASPLVEIVQLYYV